MSCNEKNLDSLLSNNKHRTRYIKSVLIEIIFTTDGKNQSDAWRSEKANTKIQSNISTQKAQ